MIAFKLMRVNTDGTVSPLFIGRDRKYELDTWYDAESIQRNGFKFRPGFHCCSTTSAPHIKRELKSGETRTWVQVQISDFEQIKRPESQGGLWYIAKKIKFVAIMRI